MNGTFRDRRDGGRRLANLLTEYAGRSDVVVLALQRGGVPVGFEIASALRIPFDVFTVRKLGVPGHEELAMGAIGSGGVAIVNEALVASLHIPQQTIAEVVEAERHELARRERAYRDGRPFPELQHRTVVLVDDGLATGASMIAAVHALRRHAPAAIVVAVPVAPSDTVTLLRGYADDVVSVIVAEELDAVGSWYQDFTQTSDDEVRALLTSAESLQQPKKAYVH